MNYTQTAINDLFLEFHSIDRYEDRLKFYDAHFNLLPFTLPDFDTNLFTFFSADHLQQFEALLRIERRNSESLRRIFLFGKENYTFSVKPGISNYTTFNNYIIWRFLQAGNQLKHKVRQELSLISESSTPVKTILASVNEMLLMLKRKVASDNRRLVNTQFTLVFLKGLTDFNTNGMPVISPKRKKIIELYLYTQGIIYGEYIQMLKGNILYKEEEIAAQPTLDTRKKISLLKELGLIDAIRKKYPFLNKADLDKKTEEIVYLFTGERMTIHAIYQ